jgi:hypothetical protein
MRHGRGEKVKRNGICLEDINSEKTMSIRFDRSNEEQNGLIFDRSNQ